MMSFDAPAPRPFARLSKDGNEIKIRIAARRPVLEIIEDLLEAHDGGGLHVTALAEAAAEQCVREEALRWSHVFDGQAFSGLGDKMPVESLVFFKVENRFGFLVRCEGGHKIVGAIRHFLRGRKGE